MRLLITVSISIILSLRLSAQEVTTTTTTHEVDGSVVITGKNYSFSVHTPPGWVEVAYTNLPPTFFPKRGDSMDRSIQMSAWPNDKSLLRVKNAKELTILDEKRDKVRDSRTRYEAAGTLKTSDGNTVLLYTVQRSTSRGLIAYADQDRTITSISLVGDTDEAIQASRATFEQFVGSYRFITSHPQSKRR